MNLLRGFIASGLVALSVLAASAGEMTFDKTDFAHAQVSRKDGKILVLVELSEAGLAKIKSQRSSDVGRSIELHLGGEVLRLKMRALIRQNKLEMGPFSPEAASKIAGAINHQE